MYIRRADKADVNQLRHFRCYNNGREWTRIAQTVIREAADEIEAESRDIGVFVAHTEGVIYGAAVFGPCPLPLWTDSSLMILGLGVNHQRRRQRIGTDLKRSVMAETAARGLLFVVSEVHRANFEMVGLNDKLKVQHTPWVDQHEHYFCAIRVRPSRRESILRRLSSNR